MAQILILDNEPVQALLHPQHSKHRSAMAYMEVPAQRNRRKVASLSVIVPTTVRVEAGWDRAASRSAIANRLPIADHALDTSSADRAANLRNTLGVSLADAHIGAVLEATQGEISILTSDGSDLRRIVHQTGHLATIVLI